MSHGTRERACVKAICDFFHCNPGREVALVFGVCHDFTPHIKSLQERFSPRLKVIIHPRIFDFDPSLDL